MECQQDIFTRAAAWEQERVQATGPGLKAGLELVRDAWISAANAPPCLAKRALAERAATVERTGELFCGNSH